METAENLKINSVVNLQLPVDVDVSVSADTVGEQLAPRFVARSGVGPLHGAEARDPGVAGTWHWGLPHVSGMAGAGECYEHVIGDGRVASALSSK